MLLVLPARNHLKVEPCKRDIYIYKNIYILSNAFLMWCLSCEVLANMNVISSFQRQTWLPFRAIQLLCRICKVVLRGVLNKYWLKSSRQYWQFSSACIDFTPLDLGNNSLKLSILVCLLHFDFAMLYVEYFRGRFKANQFFFALSPSNGLIKYLSLSM